MAGLEVHVTPADGGPSFDALLVGGNREYEDGDVDKAALVQVQRVDNLWDPVGEPEYVRDEKVIPRCSSQCRVSCRTGCPRSSTARWRSTS